jgi:hypothetical protein
MTSLRLRRALAVLALTASSLILPLSDLSAAPRHESRWSGPERMVNRTFSFWHVLTSIFEKTGMRIDGNG